MARDTIKYEEKLTKFYEFFHQMMTRSRDYGSGELLYPSEVHMIDALKNHPDQNTTEIAGILGYTKGTVSKMTTSLAKKGYIRKYKSPDNNKEVYCSLTERGEIAYQGHETYELEMNRRWEKEISRITQGEWQVIYKYFDKLIQLMEMELNNESEETNSID